MHKLIQMAVMETKENTEASFARVEDVPNSRDAADSDDSSDSDTAAHREERRLVRKLDERIMPLICCIYLFSCASSDSVHSGA